MNNSIVVLLGYLSDPYVFYIFQKMYALYYIQALSQCFTSFSFPFVYSIKHFWWSTIPLKKYYFHSGFLILWKQ